MDVTGIPSRTGLSLDPQEEAHGVLLLLHSFPKPEHLSHQVI